LLYQKSLRFRFSLSIKLQSLDSFLHKGRIDERFGVAVFYPLRIEALMEAGDPALDTGIPRQRNAADGIVLLRVGVLGAFE